MDDKEIAFQIAQRFIQMEAEIEAFRAVLDRFWNHLQPWEGFVDNAHNQLLNRETTRQRFAEIQSIFDAASGDGSLIRTLHQNILMRARVS
jgi:hypothetical protein